MNICTNRQESGGGKKLRAPLAVPVALLALGLALLPFDCVYNRVFASMLIAISGASLFARSSELFCCLQQRYRQRRVDAAVESHSCR